MTAASQPQVRAFTRSFSQLLIHPLVTVDGCACPQSDPAALAPCEVSASIRCMAAHPRFPAVPDCTVLVAHESRPDEAAAIRVRARAGELVRISHGRYADTERWKGLRPEQRHHVLVRSLVDRIRPRFVVSHL